MVGLKIDSKKKKTPEWFDTLLQSKFFVPCVDHQDQRKKEMNVLCIDCSTSGCQKCLLLTHFGHNWLQIRRYIDSDSINLEDMKKHYDCGEIQPYIQNGAKVVLLNRRKQTTPKKRNADSSCRQTKQAKSNNGSSCEVCKRSLPEVKYSYCSIGCQVEAERDQRLRSLNFSLLSSSHETTPESKLTEIKGLEVSAERDLRPRSLNFTLGPSSHGTAEETQTTPESKLTEVESSSLVGRSSMSEDDKPKSQPISFRKRPRKQSNPRRAPLF